jgi:Pyruvate/2-oxoacid:ferredoxin oxidoreductase delta subunit
MQNMVNIKSSDVVYETLREHLDSLPVGFPKTDSGVEIRILKQLFTKEEADLAVQLTILPETAEQIAIRLGREQTKVEALLEEMVRKGLIFHTRKSAVTTYQAGFFLIGIYERQLGTLTEEFVRDFDQYMDEGFRDVLVFSPPKQFRTIPVHSSITPELGVTPYDNIRDIVKRQSKLAVMECICKKKSDMLGEGCDAPRDVCMTFSSAAWTFLEAGLAREITQEEALQILDEGEAAGLVCSPSNDQKGTLVCLCCGCCCDILKSYRKYPKPSEICYTNYFTVVDTNLCTGCETCLDRCPMDAIKINEGKANIDLNFCIGCGLCVSTCPSDALTLKRKDESAIHIPPKSMYKLYERAGIERMAHKQNKS